MNNVHSDIRQRKERERCKPQIQSVKLISVSKKKITECIEIGGVMGSPIKPFSRDGWPNADRSDLPIGVWVLLLLLLLLVNNLRR